MTLSRALRRSAIAVFSIAGLSVTPSAVSAGPVLIELFTSQGCSNCPPADALLGELVEREDVVALSLPVDYWNYLGWEDTFGKAAHSDRQRAYSDARGDGMVYTPQIVVAGSWHVIGSDRAAVETAIMAAEDLPSVELSITGEGDGLHVVIPAASDGSPDWGTVWLVMYDDSETVEIGRGENAGRTLTYHHIVLEMHRLTMWRGESMSIELPMMELEDIGADGCVVFIQQDDANGRPGRVVAVATYELH